VTLTLNIGNALLEDLLENLGVLKLLLDLGNDGLGKLLLLALLNLVLVAHPGFENLLGLGSKGSALLELVSLSLELGGFLENESSTTVSTRMRTNQSYLGNSEELLGNVNNAGHLGDVVDTLLDSVGVVGTGSVQDVLVLLDLTLGPLGVSGTTVLANSGEDREQTESGDSLLVHDVQFIADGGDGQTSGGREGSGLGDQGVSGDGVENGLGLLRGLLGGNVGGRARRGQVGSDGRDTTDGKDRPKSGCA
jgi:hypothetical protein